MTRRQLSDYAKLLFGLGPPVRGRVRGKVGHFWRRHRLLTDDEAVEAMDQRMDARRRAAAETPSAHTLRYCRVCRMLMLADLEESHRAGHTEEEIGGRQHTCFRCRNLLPAGQPFQLVCADCEGKTGEGLKLHKVVMTAITAEAEQPEAGAYSHLHAQVDFVQQALQETLEEDDLLWPGMQEELGEENGGG